MTGEWRCDARRVGHRCWSTTTSARRAAWRFSAGQAQCGEASRGRPGRRRSGQRTGSLALAQRGCLPHRACGRGRRRGGGLRRHLHGGIGRRRRARGRGGRGRGARRGATQRRRPRSGDGRRGVRRPRRSAAGPRDDASGACAPVVHAGVGGLSRRDARGRVGRRQPRVLARRGARRRQLTVDDSWAAEQVAEGLLSAEGGVRRSPRPCHHALGRRRLTGRSCAGDHARALAGRAARAVHRRPVERGAGARGRSRARRGPRRARDAGVGRAPSRRRGDHRGTRDDVTVAVIDVNREEGSQP